jgi:hypothetical protein
MFELMQDLEKASESKAYESSLELNLFCEKEKLRRYLESGE